MMDTGAFKGACVIRLEGRPMERKAFYIYETSPKLLLEARLGAPHQTRSFSRGGTGCCPVQSGSPWMFVP